MAIKDTFLTNFNPVQDTDFQTLIPGRVGCIPLRGAKGALDLYVAYLPTGSGASAERAYCMDRIGDVMQPRTNVLSLIFGDFNFVECDKDRWNKEQNRWSGSHDENDAQHFKGTLGDPHGFHEIHQKA